MSAVLPADALPAPTRSPWVIGPWVDALFVCGGAVWIVALVDRLAHRAQVSELLFALPLLATALTYLSSNAHTAATLLRIYADPVERRRFSTYTGWLLIPVAALLATGFLVDGAAPAMVKLYLLWVMQHYAGQTVGFVLIYAYKRGYPLDAPARSALGWLFTAIWVYGVVVQLNWRDADGGAFLGLQLPAWGLLPPWAGRVAMAAVAGMLCVNAGLALRTHRSSGRWPPVPAVGMLASYLALTFAPGRTHTLLWLWVPMLFHGSQYVLLSASYHLKTRGTWTHKLVQAPAALYFLAVMAGGAAIYKVAPWVVSQAGVPYATGFGTLFAVANFHHFLTDRAIWRLRDPVVRDRLLA